MGLGLSGLRLGLGQQLWGTVWSPAKLFPTGTEVGLFLDFSDISTLYTDQTFATNISAIGDPVGGVLDKSGNGNHLIQATAAARPIWTRHPKSGVRNLLDASEDLAAPSEWTPVTATSTPGVADPLGGSTAVRVTPTGALGYIVTNNLGAPVSQIMMSAWLRSADGSPMTLHFRTATILGSAKSVTGTWQRFDDLIAGTSLDFRVQNRTDTRAFEIAFCQVEDAATATAYQTRVSKYDVTEAGVDDCYGLTFDGVDDYLVTAANLDLSGDDQVFACMGADMTDVATAAWALDTYTAVSTPSFTIKAPMSDGVSSVNTTSSGNGTRVSTAGQSVSAPFVLSAWSDISAPSVIDRLDGASGTAVTTSQGTGNQSSGTLTLAARNSDKTLLFTGTIYGVTLTDYTLDAEQLAALETWTAARTPEVTLA